MLRTEREVAARLRAVVVDRAMKARDAVVFELAAVQRGAAIAGAADLEIGAAIDDERRLSLDDRIAPSDLDGVVRGAAARATGLAIERRFVAFARRPCVVDLHRRLPAAHATA